MNNTYQDFEQGFLEPIEYKGDTFYYTFDEDNIRWRVTNVPNYNGHMVYMNAKQYGLNQAIEHLKTMMKENV